MSTIFALSPLIHRFMIDICAVKGHEDETGVNHVVGNRAIMELVHVDAVILHTILSEARPASINVDKCDLLFSSTCHFIHE